MSRDGFLLTIEQDMTPKGLADLFIEACEFPESTLIEVEVDKNEPQTYAVCSLDTVDIFARHFLSSPARHLGREIYGFSTSVSIDFNSMLWDSMPYEVAKETTENFLLKSTLRLLETHPMNLVLNLSVNGHIVALRFFNGQLFLNTYHPTWTPERLAWVTLPYVFEEIK